MTPDKIFGLIALLCLLFWLLPGVVPMSPRARETMARVSYLLLGGAIVAALLMSAMALLA